MTNNTGKVIPFQQGASFYMRRGAKEMERNDLLAALVRYRQAYLHDPNDAEPCLAVAEILSQMQRFEESNRMILLLMSAGNGTPECHFGLACNYFGLREYDYAADSLENYLDADPDGAFALEAEDFLDFLDDDDAMYELTGLKTDADYDDDASCQFARHLIEAGDYADAISELERQVTRSPQSAAVKNQLAIAYYCNGERVRAHTLTTQLLSENPCDVLARCNMALFCHESGDDAKAAEHLAVVQNLGTDLPEELHNLSIMELSLGQYESAERTLKRLQQILPFDENVLHKLGYCHYMQDNTEEAQKQYKRLLTIDPGDTVAKYYLEQCSRSLPGNRKVSAKWSIAYQVPFPEVFRRLTQINKYLSLSEQELLRLWQEDSHFSDMLDWALTLPEHRVKKSVLSLIYTFGDAKAERTLRAFLLYTSQPDYLKRAVFGMLKHLGAQEPYAAYLNGQWIQGRVNMLEVPYKLPACYEAVTQYLVQCMVGVRSDECVSAAAHIYRKYLDSLETHFPRISEMQAASLAAALEYCACIACGVDAQEEEIIAAYRISNTRFRNALLKLTPFRETPEESK